MPKLPPTFRPATQRDKRERDREHDARRVKQRGYDTRWDKARRKYLGDDHPLCVICERLGPVTEATVVDHIVPYRGDRPAAVLGHDQLAVAVQDSHDREKQRRSGGKSPLPAGAL